ncbi:type II toxin-antitoxin system VapC family toxin [Candidatus Riflebacteria bacterium]
MGGTKLKNIFILDTCAWLWLSIGSGRITAKIEKKLKKGPWLLPTICVWEMATLVKKGRIELDRPLKRWIAENLSGSSNLRLTPLKPEIAIISTQLDKCKSNDPADRIILVTAIEEKGILVTADSHLIKFCKKEGIPILEL